MWTADKDEYESDLHSNEDYLSSSEEVMGSNPIQAWIFWVLIFTTAQEVFITAKIPFLFTSFFTVHMYDFHIFPVVIDLIINL